MNREVVMHVEKKSKLTDVLLQVRKMSAIVLNSEAERAVVV